MLDGHFKWSKKLGFLYFLDAKKDGRIDQEKMKQALVEYEKALSASNSGLGRDHLLLRCAEACLMLKDFDKGDSYGQQVLEAYKVSDYYFAYDLFHKANLVLGKISLERGDVEKAKRLLLMAAEEGALRQGHPLSGPYMKLALRMLELGEKGTVLEYLRKCAKVWTMPNHELDQWIRIIEEGRIPNFGPVYLIN
ncbi:MAG: tetratricopeptide repeat protein [Gemmataceae bacterium]